MNVHSPVHTGKRTASGRNPALNAVAPSPTPRLCRAIAANMDTDKASTTRMQMSCRACARGIPTWYWGPTTKYANPLSCRLPGRVSGSPRTQAGADMIPTLLQSLPPPLPLCPRRTHTPCLGQLRRNKPHYHRPSFAPLRARKTAELSAATPFGKGGTPEFLSPSRTECVLSHPRCKARSHCGSLGLKLASETETV